MGNSNKTVAAAAALFIWAATGAAVAQVALPEAVESAPLARDAFSTGTLDATNGALPPTLWDDADPQTLDYLLTRAPSRPATPSLGIAMKRTLLSSGAAPEGASPSLGGKKLYALARAGFVEEARTIASLSTIGGSDPWTAQAVAVADLLAGNVSSACQRNANLGSGRDELFWVKLRVYCYARADERDAADLTLNVVREQGALTQSELAFLTAAATGIMPKSAPTVRTAIEYAIARNMNMPLAPGLIADADGGVMTAIARDGTIDPATRIAAVQHAAGMGVLGVDTLTGVFQGIDFETLEFSNAVNAAQTRSDDPLTDALLYQSVRNMSAPEFIRDKAQRIGLAISLADSFSRAYSLSLLYADEIAALEGVIVTPEEAAHFATVRMAVGDSVGAGYWLAAMVGANNSIEALPQPQAMAFIDRVNLLAVLDPQTAARVARAAGVSLLSAEPQSAPLSNSYEDPAVMARLVSTAIDAAASGKLGQAALVALAASNGGAHGGGEIEAAVIGQSLGIAGLAYLGRRQEFEQAWAATFIALGSSNGVEEAPADETDGLAPRIKPQNSQ